MFKSSHLFFLFLSLIFSCSEAKEDSQEIPAESFRNEVPATEVKVANAERKRFDYLIQFDSERNFYKKNVKGVTYSIAY